MLGQPNILWDDKPLSVDRKATRTLLYYLASQTKPVGRSTLCEFFWPSPDGDDARRKLRSLLSKLRSSLPDPTCLISNGDHVSLDLSEIYVDIHDYLSQYNALQNIPWCYSEETLLPAPIIDSLLRSESLWRGSHFLESTKLVSSPGLDNWLTYTNETLISARQLCLERLASHYIACGEPKTAIKYLLELLPYDDMNPELFHKLIMALIRGGYRKEAGKVIEHISERYENQTGSPLPHQLIKDKELFQITFSKNQNTSLPVWPGSLSINLPLVGRQKELNTLQLAFQKGGILVLKGEAGSGKTRLIKELYERSWPNIRLLLANCYEADQNMPMQVFVDMLRSDINREEWENLPSLWANFLTLIMPDLTDIKPNLVIPERPIGAHGEGLIFEALMNIMRLASKKQRVLFVLDDAQWVDVSSLSAIQYLVSHGFFKNNGLLLISCRQENFDKRLESMIRSLARTEVVSEVLLSGLIETDVSQLVNHLIPAPVNESFIHLLVKETNGNPYLILETINTLQEDSPSGQIDDRQTTIPIARSIQSLLKHRQSHLDPQSIEVLMAASVLGAEIDLDILEKVVSLPSKELQIIINTLILRGFITPILNKNGSFNHFRFTHSMEEEAILSGLDPSVRQNLHLKIGQILETVLQEGVKVQASRIAQHYRNAGKINRAIKWWLLAAKRAWDLFSESATDQAYREVENVFEQSRDDITEKDAFTYFSQRALYLFEIEELDSLDHVCHTCLEWGQQYKSPLLIGLAFYNMSYATYLRKHYHEGLGYLEKAILYLSSSNNTSVLGEAYIRKGILLAMVQRYEEAIHSFDFALDIAKKIEAPEIMESLFQAHAQKSLCYYIIGKPRDGLKEIEDAYEKYQYILKPLNQLRAHYSFSNNLFNLGLYSDAFDHAEKGRKLAQSIGRTSTELSFQLTLARIEMRKGNLDEGLALVNDSIQKAKASKRLEYLTRAYVIMGETFIHMEDFKKAADVLRLSSYYPNNAHAFYETQGRLAFALIRIGCTEEGEKILQEVLDSTLQTGMTGVYIEASLFQTYLLFSRGKIEAVDLLIEDMAEKAFSIGMVEICMLVKQLQLTAAGMLGKYKKLDALQTEISTWSLENNVPWSHLKIIPEWLKYTKKSFQEKARQCDLSLKLIKQIEPHAQSEEMKASFENARKRWTQGFNF